MSIPRQVNILCVVYLCNVATCRCFCCFLSSLESCVRVSAFNCRPPPLPSLVWQRERRFLSKDWKFQVKAGATVAFTQADVYCDVTFCSCDLSFFAFFVFPTITQFQCLRLTRHSHTDQRTGQSESRSVQRNLLPASLSAARPFGGPAADEEAGHKTALSARQRTSPHGRTTTGQCCTQG